MLSGLPVTTPEEAERAADVLIGRGAGAVVITMGAAGALLRRDGRQPMVPAVRAGPVVDTTGAGDSFNAGIAVALSEGRSLEQALSLRLRGRRAEGHARRGRRRHAARVRGRRPASRRPEPYHARHGGRLPLWNIRGLSRRASSRAGVRATPPGGQESSIMTRAQPRRLLLRRRGPRRSGEGG